MNNQQNLAGGVIPYQNSQYFQQYSDRNQQMNLTDRQNPVGEAMSYTPPRSGSEKARKRGHPKWRKERSADQNHNYPL
jgi:hypothetical protein